MVGKNKYYFDLVQRYSTLLSPCVQKTLPIRKKDK